MSEHSTTPYFVSVRASRLAPAAILGGYPTEAEAERIAQTIRGRVPHWAIRVMTARSPEAALVQSLRSP